MIGCSARALEGLFDGPTWAEEPGCAVSLVQGDEAVWIRGFGSARLESGVPIGPATRFRVASITKPMFALVMLALEDEGLLRLSDDLDRHVSELASSISPTVAQVLAMKAGVLETYDLNWLAAGSASSYDLNFGAEQALSLLLRQRTLNFPPGERTLYSNGGYLLCQVAAERASGEPLGQLLRTRVFDQAGMDGAVLADGRATHLAGQAAPYALVDGAWRLRESEAQTGAAGGVVASLLDMNRFWSWLRGNPRRWRERLAASWTFESGVESGYAIGFQRQRVAGRLVLGHAGGLGPYLCQTLWAPDSDTTVTVLGNRNDINWLERAREVLVTWWGTNPDPACTPRLVRAEAPKPRWTATYAREASLTSLSVAGAERELLVDGRRLPAGPDGVFRRFLGEEELVIDAGNDIAEPPREIVRTFGPVREVLTRADDESAPPLEFLAGVYRHVDLPEALQVALAPAGGLSLAVGLRWPADRPLRLELVTGRLFRAPESPHGLHLRFEADVEGRAQGVSVATGRLTGLLFQRTDEPLDRTWRFRDAQPRLLPWSAEAR